MPRALIALTAAAFLLSTAVWARQEAPVLVELFTSQGCNSCPAADAVLAELTEDPSVLPLAFHVTYWDRLGWKDLFADERFTERQRDYARLLGASSIYTPQAVIAGRLDIVGSSRNQLLQAIHTVREHGEAELIAIDDAGELLIPAGLRTEQAVLWAVAWDYRHEVAIARGENAGRTLSYHHVVRWLEQWRSPADQTALPLAELRQAGHAGAAVILQRQSDGHVLAIGRIDL